MARLGPTGEIRQSWGRVARKLRNTTQHLRVTCEHLRDPRRLALVGTCLFDIITKAIITKADQRKLLHDLG
jgi:hypothetical protein